MKQILRPLVDCLPSRAKAVLKALRRPSIFPRILQVEPTRKCNLRCIMCARTHYGWDVQPDMSLELFKKILTQMPPGLDLINIQGVGEPLMCEDLVGMIEFARGMGYKTRFNSNLQLLTRDMAERLVACRHTEVMVSIETVDPRLYADIRRGGTLDRVVANIRELHEAKQRAGGDFPEISVCAILMKPLLPKIPEMVQTLRGLGVTRMHFADLATYEGNTAKFGDGTCINDAALVAGMTEEEMWAAVREIKALEDEHFTITVPGEFGGLDLGRPQGVGVVTCKELWEAPFITCDGYVTPCCWVPSPSIYNMGNFNDQTFEEIWFGEAYRRMRWQHVTGRPPKYCVSCRQRYLTFATPSRLSGKAETAHVYHQCFLRRSA